MCSVAFYAPAAAAGIMLRVWREKLTLAPAASKYDIWYLFSAMQHSVLTMNFVMGMLSR